MRKYRITHYIIGIILLGLVSCSTKETMTEDEIITVTPEDSIFTQAEEANKEKQFSNAENYYKQALSLPALSSSQKALSYLRLASIATNRADYPTALSYLLLSVTIAPEYINLIEWYTLLEQSVLFLSDERALQVIQNIMVVCGSSGYENGVVYISAAYLLGLRGKVGDALYFAKEGWDTARTNEQRAYLEEVFYRYVNNMPREIVSLFIDTVTDKNKVAFPYNIFYLEKGVMLTNTVADTSAQQEGKDILDTLRKNGSFFSKNLITSSSSTQQKATQGSKNIALLLPLSSPQYKRFTQQIVNGATVALDMVKRVDSTLRVHYIDTESKDWLSKVQELPTGTIIGGPLRQATFASLQQEELVNKFIFLTFLQTLPDGVEGVSAWRFYNSPYDQINALYRFGRSLGITSYGILSPQDQYASKMVAFFKEGAPQYKSSIAKVVTYGKKESLWTKEVGKYLNTRIINKQPVAYVPFGATFLPDSFKNATIMIPNLFYNGDHSQIIMGTSLWEERGQQRSSKETFQFAVYPTPFNPTTTDEYAKALTKALQSKTLGSTTRWSALGFDFVRFAYTMANNQLSSSNEINAFLSQTKNIKWVSAPFSWSQKGICRQNLFIVTPKGDSAQLVNVKLFAKELQKVYKLQEKRVKALLGR